MSDTTSRASESFFQIGDKVEGLDENGCLVQGRVALMHGTLGIRDEGEGGRFYHIPPERWSEQRTWD